MQNILIYLMAGVVLLLDGCALHTPDVQQGNVLEPEVVAQLHAGLTRKQVQFLMGTPVLQDPFHPERWDYIYWFKVQGKKPVEHRVTVFFDKDVVSRLETKGLSLPKPPPPAEPSKAEPSK